MEIIESSNDRFIREVSTCNGDPVCVALRQAEHFARVTARLQLDDIILKEIVREQAELRVRFEEFVGLTEQNRELIRTHLAHIDQRIANLVPAEKIQALLEQLEQQNDT